MAIDYKQMREEINYVARVETMIREKGSVYTFGKIIAGDKRLKGQLEFLSTSLEVGD